VNAFPASPFLVGGIFAVFVVLTAAGAILAALSARIIRSVCGLALCSVGLAGLYYFLRSPFLALMEILVYVGAVCVTIVFAVMLAEPQESSPDQERRDAIWWGGASLLVSAGICGSLWWLGQQQAWSSPPARVSDGSLKAIGTALLTTYSLAFELISLVLLVAILGALVVARSGRTRP
jgi:NADH:ubiquinone oxidoreductase subunit 6 (subunit J)